MMYYFNTLMPEVILPSMTRGRTELNRFLQTQGLDFEDDIEYSIILRHEEEIIATGSYSKNILKCIAVKEKYQGMGLSQNIVSLLVAQKHMSEHEHLFLFTQIENESMFKDLGFHKIAASSKGTILMETPKKALVKYLEELKTHKKQGRQIGCIVANCNPFTLGHLYLMEYAAAKCDVLYVFVVSEEASVFPAQVRYELVVEGTKHIPNIVVLLSGPYIISTATFPTYFLKDKKESSLIHAEIDVDIFGSHIAPILGINKRFIGSEPSCKLTLEYNKVISKQLPLKGIEVDELTRLQVCTEVISASRVRALIKDGDLESLGEYVPKTTYDFLTSNEAKDILDKIAKMV